MALQPQVHYITCVLEVPQTVRGTLSVKKTLITAALVASLSLVAVACDNDDDPTAEPTAEPAAAEEITEAPAEEITEAPAEEVTEAPAEEVTEAPAEEEMTEEPEA